MRNPSQSRVKMQQWWGEREATYGVGGSGGGEWILIQRL